MTPLSFKAEGPFSFLHFFFFFFFGGRTIKAEMGNKKR